jgi:hypothetical protein
VHVRHPVWNLLVDNPAGYLPPHSGVQAIEIALEPIHYLPWGPDWARGWEIAYFAPMMLVALWLRARWGVK